MKSDKIGVAGLGVMGCGIAQVTLTSGHRVIVMDTDQNLVDHGIAQVERALDKQVRKGVMDAESKAECMSRIQGTTLMAGLKDCDLIIEAVYEERAAKRALFEQLDAICLEKTLFASNTSSLSITGLASGLGRVARFLGLHFFNPVPHMKLVEVIRTPATSEETLTTALGFVRSIGKTPVMVRDQAGFMVNYLLTPYLFDAIRSLSSGLGSVSDIDKAMHSACGHPMGPLALCDFIGLDILYRAGNILYEEHRDRRFSVPPLLKRLVELGDVGVKAGRGFYEYHTPQAPCPRDLAGL